MCDPTPSRLTSRLTAAAANLSLLVIGLVFALALGEVLVRVFVGNLPELMDKSDPVFGARYYRNAVGARYVDGRRVDIRINSQGFHSPEYGFSRPANTRRLLFLGDSFTAATEVELPATFHQRCAASLTERVGQAVQSVSLGVGGLSTAQEYLVYATEGVKYQSDVVVLCFFPGNDVLDDEPQLSRSHRPYFTLDGNGRLQAQPFQPRWSKNRNWLRQSALYRWQKLVTSRVAAGWQRGRNADPRFHTYHEPTDALWTHAWQVTEALLLAIRDLADQRGEKLLLLIIPERYQVNPAEWESILRAYPAMRQTTFDLGYPQRRLGEFCRSNGIAILDPLPAFRLAARHQPLYNREEGHLAAAGHTLLAQQLSQHLAASGWLDDAR